MQASTVLTTTKNFSALVLIERRVFAAEDCGESALLLSGPRQYMICFRKTPTFLDSYGFFLINLLDSAIVLHHSNLRQKHNLEPMQSG